MQASGNSDLKKKKKQSNQPFQRIGRQKRELQSSWIVKINDS